MSKITFTREEKELAATKLQRYLQDELDLEVGQFDAEFLFDFVTKEFGAALYNKGVEQAQLVLAQKLQEIDQSIDEVRL